MWPASSSKMKTARTRYTKKHNNRRRRRIRIAQTEEDSAAAMRGLPHDEKQARPDPGCEIPRRRDQPGLCRQETRPWRLSLSRRRMSCPRRKTKALEAVHLKPQFRRRFTKRCLRRWRPPMGPEAKTGFLRLLGLAKRAGRTELGEDGVSGAAADGKARVVFLAADAAENSIRRARNVTASSHAEVLPFHLPKKSWARPAAAGAAPCWPLPNPACRLGSAKTRGMLSGRLR